MSEYYVNEEILKGYDHKLMRRLISYLKPYRLLFIIAVASLLIGTAAEMVLPILLKQAVDENILPQYRQVEASAPKDITAAMAEGKKSIVIGNTVFVPTSAMIKYSKKEKQYFDKETWIAVRLTEKGRTVAAKYPNSVITDGKAAAFPEKAAKSFPKSDYKTLREGSYRGLRRRVVQYLLSLIVLLAVSFAQILLMTYISQRVMQDLRTDLFRHTLGLSLHYIDSNPVGRLVTRTTNDVETINDLFTSVMTSFFKDFSLIVGVFITLFILSSRLTLFSLIFLPPLFIAALIFRNTARDAFRKVRLSISRFNAFLSEHLSGMSIVQLFAKEKASSDEFEERNEKMLRAQLRELYVFAAFRPLVDVLAAVALAVIIYIGAASFLAGAVSLGVLIAFLNLIKRFFEPVQDISEQYNIMQSAMAGSERVFALMDEKTIIPQMELPSSIPEKAGSVVFDHVYFEYKPGEPVIRDLSFSVKKGENIAVVGFTGAGKTTLISLLTRLWDIQHGTIFLNGTDIKDLEVAQLRRKVQPVQQDVFLFSGTVAENISLGSDIPMEKIIEAAGLVRADGFISRLEHGYDTVLQERGSNLSIGQRQLLSFARVIAHNPDVLILDEATANIDTETELLIQQALEVLLRGRTSIVIAHRLSTIKRADRILVLHHGRLLEEGTHGELIRKKGMYYKLYKMQYREMEGS